MQEKMTKEKTLLAGKGEVEEWITMKGNHIPVESGESKAEAIEKFIQQKQGENKVTTKEKTKDKQIQGQAQNTQNLPRFERNLPPPDTEAEELKKIQQEQKREEVEKELANRWAITWSKLNKRQKRQTIRLLNTEPIQFDIGDKVLNIAFNKITLGKNLKKKFKSDLEGLNWKRNNINKFSETLKNLKLDHSEKEVGKNDPSHFGINNWHYLVGEYTDGNITFNVVANIADKGEEQFLYELAMTEKSKKIT